MNRKDKVTELTMKMLTESYEQRINVKKEGYTGREEFEAGLEKYVAKGEGRSEEDIKVVAEVGNYLLTASQGINNPERIYLDVFSGSERSVEVFIRQDYKGKVEKAVVNWSALGDVTADEALAFGKKIQDAAEFCKEIEGKDYSEVFNKKTESRLNKVQ